jgi:hypothetical protein
VIVTVIIPNNVPHTHIRCLIIILYSVWTHTFMHTYILELKSILLVIQWNYSESSEKLYFYLTDKIINIKSVATCWITWVEVWELKHNSLLLYFRSVIPGHFRFSTVLLAGQIKLYLYLWLETVDMHILYWYKLKAE